MKLVWAVMLSLEPRCSVSLPKFPFVSTKGNGLTTLAQCEESSEQSHPVQERRMAPCVGIVVLKG
eukprot:6178709-Pleurochrysis_carterae.AAC.4